MEIITEQKINQIAGVIGEVLEKNIIDYLISGSFAYKLLIGDSQVKVHDLDIIIHQDDFDKIVQLLSEPKFNLNPIVTSYSIHANHKIYKGDDGRPFDISLDSFEHFYKDYGLDSLPDSEMVDLFGKKVKVATKKGLISVYECALKGSNTAKFPKYLEKIAKLKK